jgi:glyoxylase-like metal-dependent hydrolase (beta-lactamase superfamily II)
MPTAALPSGVEAILAPNPSLMTGAGTTTYVVSGEDNSRANSVVIDPGPLIESHLQAVVSRSPATITSILITHGHPDHMEGAARLRGLTGAPILAFSRQGVPVLDRELADGEAVPVGKRNLRALHTPGHRFDHLCFLLEDSAAVFAGDLVAGTGTVVIAPPEGNLRDYIASLRRLLDLDLQTILPAHGPVITEPHKLLVEYISHRQLREQQVLERLAAGPATVAAMVESIYADVDPKLHGMAALSLTAHLDKLESEGRATRTVSASGVEIWSLTTP